MSDTPVVVPDFRQKMEVAALNLGETIVKTEVDSLPSPYREVGVAVEALIENRSAENWIRFGEAVFTAIAVAEAKLPPGAVQKPIIDQAGNPV